MSHTTVSQVNTVSKLPPNQEQTIHSAIAGISHIATLPEVTLKVIQLVEDPNSTAQDLNHVISNDPALGARILKVVNSSFYGLPGQIGTINRAIMLLGHNGLKNVAIAASLTKLFRGGQICQSLTARNLWAHSIAVASGSKILAERIKLGLPDKAFLAGLIHDLGIMVEMQVHRPQLIEVIEKLDNAKDLTFRQAELDVLGATHEQFGSALCRMWKFPANFANVTGYHHRPLELDERSRTLTALIHIADIMAAKLEIGYTRTVEVKQVDPDLLDQLKLTQETIDEITQQIPEATNEAASMLRG